MWRATLAERQSALSQFRAQQVVGRIIDNDPYRARLDLIAIHEVMTGDCCYCACDHPTSFFANEILAASRKQTLLVVPGWYGFHGYACRQIEEPVRLEARLTRAIMKGHGEIRLEERAYCILPLTAWAKEILSWGDWEVVRLPEAKVVLGRMALQAKCDDEKKAIAEAAGLLVDYQQSRSTCAGATRLPNKPGRSVSVSKLPLLPSRAANEMRHDWRPPLPSPAGLVLLLRRVRVLQAETLHEEPITPSQRQKLKEPKDSWIKIHLVCAETGEAIDGVSFSLKLPNSGGTSSHETGDDGVVRLTEQRSGTFSIEGTDHEDAWEFVSHEEL